jgi:uncharacterized protein (TIGR00369 family)
VERKAAHSPVVDRGRVRQATGRIQSYLDQEMSELGADPTALAQQAISQSGVAWLSQWVRPQIPPPPTIAVLFGAEWLEVEDSHVKATFEPAEWMFNPFGAVYGGLLATPVDVVLGAAVHTALPAGTGYATSDLHVRYLRAITASTGRVLITGTVVHCGRRHAIAEARVTAEATGKLVATATADCAILRPS